MKKNEALHCLHVLAIAAGAWENELRVESEESTVSVHLRFCVKEGSVWTNTWKQELEVTLNFDEFENLKNPDDFWEAVRVFSYGVEKGSEKKT